MKKVKFLIIIFVVAALKTACFQIENVSEIPRVEFISFEIFDSIDYLQNRGKGGRLKFRFEDGDGDIGILRTTDNDTTNLKLTLYRKIDGEMQPVTDGNDPLLASNYRIPFLRTIGQSKVVRGTIDVVFFYFFYNQADTIKYSFFITDRAGNQSNIEYTAEIIVSQNGIYRKE